MALFGMKMKDLFTRIPNQAGAAELENQSWHGFDRPRSFPADRKWNWSVQGACDRDSIIGSSAGKSAHQARLETSSQDGWRYGQRLETSVSARSNLICPDRVWRGAR